MTVEEFCCRLASRIGTSKARAKKIFRAVMAEGRAIVEEGDEWVMPGFGKVYYVEVKPYSITFYRNGEKIQKQVDRHARIRMKFHRNKFESQVKSYDRITRTF